MSPNTYSIEQLRHMIRKLKDVDLPSSQLVDFKNTDRTSNPDAHVRLSSLGKLIIEAILGALIINNHTTESKWEKELLLTQWLQVNSKELEFACMARDLEKALKEFGTVLDNFLNIIEGK